ncbi:MAG: FtsW/RodA/SpoVE family cell cycle protein [Alistipes sp.]|nr:FtsW/RodA/SpoVE family cell cycle protein [Alistipes sp.]
MAKAQIDRDEEMMDEMPQRRISVFEGDRMLWIIFMVLLVVSILVVYSSTAKMAYDVSSTMTTADSLRQQIMLVVLAVPLLFVVHKIDYKYFMRFTPLLYYLFILLTIATYFIGATTNGAARWIALGPIQFQPSEGLKIMTILMLAKRMDGFKSNINKVNLLPTSIHLGNAKQKRILKENTWPLLGPVIISCGVIMPAHTSSAILIFITSVIMLFIGRVRIKELLKFVVVMGAAGIILLTLFSAVGMGRGDTAGGRFSVWLEEWMGEGTVESMYELSDTQRAMIAIHDGGLLGEGAGQSTARAVVIHPESDYAYSFFISEYGLIIALILMFLYLWIFFRSIEIFRRCTTVFPGLMTLGLGLLITCQALLHILVQVNIIPETGQTLPLISRGGSSLLFTTIALGLILSVSRKSNMERETTIKDDDDE